MKRLLFLVFVMLVSLLASSQLKIKNKKYPSLLWEISGNGLKKPSYLFGTMHVSSKLAFHLSDSFYHGIRQADVVALETNPESWQEDMSKYEIDNYRQRGSDWRTYMQEIPNDYLTIRSLRFTKYEKLLESALFTEPSVINNLLYRSYSDNASDFEEDTYLDMYIYQIGKKLGKRVAGVEDYAESMKLMMEAYQDAAMEKNRKEKSYDYDTEISPNKLQEAYRTGNLDLLDSINRLNSYSDAFDEKFLFKRNEIQANSIDSILKKSTLFVGVGAAHLPGPRGVIELLRRMGYRLRPVIMGSRDSKHKDQVEKIRVGVTFATQSAEDGFYKVDVPGKFYDFNEHGALDQRQYADMANGSYYMVTRVETNSHLWGHGQDVIARKIDSVLYENIPGKILSKTAITRNGYKGFDITNRTRRGDFQRYQIFITPYEVLFFKMSGNSDYVRDGEEAKRFFGSIQLKEYKNGGWRKFQPAYGGFSVELPQEPHERFDGLMIYNAEDKTSGTHFTIFRADVVNYNFVEEDSFDLNLMDESFASSEFIDKQISRKQTVHKGFPAMECKYLHKDGSVSVVRYIIQGPHYYSLISHAAKETAAMQQFINSFEIKPFIYGEVKQRTDTSLYYTVKTSWYPVPKKNKLELPAEYGNAEDEEESDQSFMSAGAFKSHVIGNDSTGEKVYVSFFKAPKYYYSKDTVGLDERNSHYQMGSDSTWITRSKKKQTWPNGMQVWELMVSDTNSSRAIWSKVYYRKGIGYMLAAQTDTLVGPGTFVKTFFDSFTPVDTLTGINPFEKKSRVYFNDLFSKDTVERKRATRLIYEIEMDSTDFPDLKKAINSFNWSDKKYLDTKKKFIH
jgi:uncharacterized protein YbaP (TraB family)